VMSGDFLSAQQSRAGEQTESECDELVFILVSVFVCW
jgi:hypothetical protein